MRGVTRVISGHFKPVAARLKGLGALFAEDQERRVLVAKVPPPRPICSMRKRGARC